MVNKEYLDYFYKMLLIRRFEEKIDWLFSRDKLGGTAHLCIGQEAVAVGVMAALKEDDYAISTHRGHGHLLAKGATVKGLFCEIMGKTSGYCAGRGGTQHLCVKDIGFLGTNGITGGGIPIATGVGLGIKLKKEKKVVVCFFGDGATNQGTFHESLNLASVWKVPVVYVCENNLYAMSTPQKESMNIIDIAQRAKSYDIKSVIVDGMDVLKVKEVAAECVKFARSEKKPVLIEAKTYRYCGHSKSDSCKYRTKQEANLWQEKDPIVLFEKELIALKMDKSEIESIRDKVANDIEKASQEALNSN